MKTKRREKISFKCLPDKLMPCEAKKQAIKHGKDSEIVLTLPSNTPISQNPHALPHTVTHTHAILLPPNPLLLRIIQPRVAMAMHQIHHDDPFGNLRAMHAICRAQRDLGVGVDGVLGNVVCACGEELDEFGGRDGFWGGGKPEEGCEVGGVVEVFCLGWLV